MVFINDTTTTGIILNAGILNVFGTEFIMIVIFIIVLLALAFAFKMPVELGIVLLVPLILYSMAQNVQMFAIGGLSLIFLAFLFAYWIIGRN